MKETISFYLQIPKESQKSQSSARFDSKKQIIEATFYFRVATGDELQISPWVTDESMTDSTAHPMTKNGRNIIAPESPVKYIIGEMEQKTMHFGQNAILQPFQFLTMFGVNSSTTDALTMRVDVVVEEVD